MALKRELIQFNIVNQTDCIFNLSLFQQNVYSVNARTKYTYDVTTADLSCGTGTIIVNGNTLNLSFAPNLTSFLAALNGLGFGFFCSETSGGNTFVYTVDDTNVYGDMDICPVVGTTTTTTTTTVTPPETTTTTTTTTVAPPPETTTTTTTTTVTPPETTTTTTTTTVAPPPETTTTTTTTTVIPPETTTTTTTTTVTPPETTTTTTTTTVTPPETTTTTTTTTVTPPPALTFSSASAGDACTGGVGMTNIVYGGGTGLCDSTTVQCDEFLTELAGATVWISDGSNVREATINDPNVSGIATFVAACNSCGVTTTTTTTTVPETTTTTTTTTIPETTTTTTTTTVPETTTTTTTTTLGFTNGYSSASSSDACTAGIAMTGIVFGGGTGLCDSTTIQTDQFALELAGVTVWVSIGGQVREATINDPNVSGIATFVAPCTTCGV